MGNQSSLTVQAKPWASVDVRPAPSKSRPIISIELEGGSSYDSNGIFELPGSGAAKHASRTHDFALALPDPDAPSDDGDEYGLDLDRTSPGIPSPAFLLPAAAAPVARAAPRRRRRASRPCPRARPRTESLPAHALSSPTAASAPRPDPGRAAAPRASGDDDASGPPPSSEYADDGDEGRHARPVGAGVGARPLREARRRATATSCSTATSTRPATRRRERDDPPAARGREPHDVPRGRERRGGRGRGRGRRAAVGGSRAREARTGRGGVRSVADVSVYILL